MNVIPLNTNRRLLCDITCGEECRRCVEPSRQELEAQIAEVKAEIADFRKRLDEIKALDSGLFRLHEETSNHLRDAHSILDELREDMEQLGFDVDWCDD